MPMLPCYLSPEQCQSYVSSGQLGQARDMTRQRINHSVDTKYHEGFVFQSFLRDFVPFVVDGLQTDPVLPVADGPRPTR